MKYFQEPPMLDLFVNEKRKKELLEYQTIMAKPIKEYIASMTDAVYAKVRYLHYWSRESFPDISKLL